MTADSANDRPLEIAIAGGGIGGLSLAIGLLNHPHLNVNIYEAAPAFAEIGAGVTVGPNARRALKLISPGTETALVRQSTGNGPGFEESKNVYCRFVYGAGPKSGHIIGDTWCDNGQQSVHRAKFLDSLVECIPPGVAHFNKRLTGVTEMSDGRVTLTFHDDTTVIADCVIGADGVHSVVRRHLMPENHQAFEPKFSKCAAYRGLIPIKTAREVLGVENTSVATMHCADGGIIMCYPIDFHQLFNVVAVDTKTFQEWDGPLVQQANLDKMNKAWSNWGPLCKNIIKLLNKPDSKIWSLWQLPDLPTYTRSKIVIMGDAAHATTPFHGQGAAQAIEDALVLSKVIVSIRRSEDLPYAFQAFDRIRRPRSQKVVRTSHEAGQMFSMRGPGIGDDEKLFKENIEDRYDWMFNRDMQLQVDQALMVIEELKIIAEQEASSASGVGLQTNGHHAQAVKL